MDLLELQITCDGDVKSVVVERFPAHVGRDEDCEVQLAYRFVSRRHARIDIRDGAYVLRDVGSRNGVVVNGKRLAPDESLPLEDGTTFALDRAMAIVRLRTSTRALGSRELAKSDLPTSLYAEQQITPEFITQAGAIVEEYRAARYAMIRAVREALDSLPPSQRAPTARGLTTLYSELANDPGLQDLLAAHGVDIAKPPRVSVEAETCLRGVRQLAEQVAPAGKVPRGATELDAFIQVLGGAAQVLSLVADGTDASPGASEGPPSSRRALFDWTNLELAAAARDRLAGGLRRLGDEARSASKDAGALVELLLGPLSPASIETAKARLRWRGPFWTRALWQEFSRRHGLVTDALERKGVASEEDEPRAGDGSTPSRLSLGTAPGTSHAPEDEERTHWPFAGPVWQ